MKIGYLMQQAADIRTPPFDGPAVHVRHVVQEWLARGHQVRVILRLGADTWVTDDLHRFSLAAPLPGDSGLPRKLEGAVRRVQSALRVPYANLFESRRFAALCARELRGANLLYERMSWMSYGGGLAARQMGIPLVLEFNGDHLHDLEAKGMAPTGLQRRLSLALMAWAARQATHIVTSGDGWREQFLRRYSVAPRRVSTVENGTALVDLLRREQLRAFCPEEGGRPLNVLYLGGFYPWHGVEVLLRAFQSLLSGGVDARLVLVGAGSHLDACRSAAQDAGLADRVTFAGQLTAEQYAPLLANADIGVSPYCGWKEYSGMKLFDYKAAGLAIIASGENGQPQTLRHRQTGWIVPPCGEEALADALKSLAQDHYLRRRIGQAARLEAETHHAWRHTAGRLEVLFQTLLERAQPQGGR
jgi:glycosyltransferase involved in cell wall biosynthesis